MDNSIGAGDSFACNSKEKGAGGAGNGYFASGAGNAGSNPALGESPGRLVAQDT